MTQDNKHYAVRTHDVVLDNDYIEWIHDIKNRFLILDYRQQFFGNELVFSGMVVDYG